MSQNPYEPPEHYAEREVRPTPSWQLGPFAFFCTLLGIVELAIGVTQQSYLILAFGIGSLCIALYLLLKRKKERI